MTFVWSTGSGVAEYWLDIGTTMGGTQLYHPVAWSESIDNGFRTTGQRERDFRPAVVTELRGLAVQ